jgi:hypothetical protein
LSSSSPEPSRGPGSGLLRLMSTGPLARMDSAVSSVAGCRKWSLTGLRSGGVGASAASLGPSLALGAGPAIGQVKATQT